MKKIIVLLILFFTSLVAKDIKNIDELRIYKTVDTNMSLEEIKSKKTEFQKISKDEKFSDKNMSYWLQIKFSDEMKSNDYMVRYVGMDFDISSFTPEQDMRRIKVGGSTKKLTFEYHKERDKQIYYFHLTPTDTDSPYFLYIQTIEEFFSDTENYFFYLVFCGFILGLILMAGLYNAFVYYYNREKAFLYYAIMQIFMVLVLVFYTGLITDTSYTMKIYNIFSLLAAFFATLFAREFFTTSDYVPKLDKVLRFYLILLAFDLIYLNITGESIVSILQLYSVFGFVYIIVGFYRLKQGFTPAKFFLIGWGSLILSLFLVEYISEDFFVSPLLLGSPVEAILLAIALAYKIKLMQDEKEQQKELLIHQSKLASMGEMIGNIAHQWRQPLTHLSYSVMNIQEAFKHNELSKEYLDKKVDEATTQIEFMSQTIDDFKDFYAPTKIKENFSLEEATQNVLEIMNHAFQEKGIVVDLVVDTNVILYNYKNEYKQVLLNLLSNAKDALVEKEIEEPKILISIYNGLVVVLDNAGGIEPHNINKIFEPYFTTKEGNSGIGLYMSKMIVEKNMGGKLSVQNFPNGAEFSMQF